MNTIRAIKKNIFIIPKPIYTERGYKPYLCCGIESEESILEKMKLGPTVFEGFKSSSYCTGLVLLKEQKEFARCSECSYHLELLNQRKYL